MRKTILIFIAVLFFTGCSHRDPVQLSPSGDYRAWLSINESPEGFRVWVVNITSEQDEVELLEFMNDYPANLMAYIAWDDDRRLWFYSSDDGCYFYWERTEEGLWNRYSWSILESSLFAPPESLNNGRNRN